MKKKYKNVPNTSGITVCDSIVMSVKKRHLNLRRLESVIIALTGYISTIMVFLCMFEFKYDKKSLVISGVVFSAVYIFLSLWGKKALWMIFVSLFAGGALLWKNVDTVALGFKFVYNIIYKAAYHTEIEYYKFLDKRLEIDSVTTFFVFAIWILAVVIYVFTIYHPHPLPSLLTAFPILEIGMYNGLEVNIFWGMMVIGYLIACFGMSTIDMGEYSGGSGGFVRKENLFFPKRQMRLKVTEKCGIYLILLVMTSALVTTGILKATGYKRSEQINERRIEIRDAVNNFSVENLADSISTLTAAFGVTFKVESHKLGNIASMKYKDRTDMIVTIDKKLDGAIYLKEFTGSVYKDNEWFTLSDSTYKDEIFDSFKEQEIYPQDFPFRFNKIFDINDPEYTIWINTTLKGNRSFAPYGANNVGELVYTNDSDVSSKKVNKNEFSYVFSNVDGDLIGSMLDASTRNVYSLGNITDEEWRQKIIDYCLENGLLNYDDYLSIDSELHPNMQLMYENPPLIMTQLIQDQYKKFVHDTYLQLPDNTNMDEVREAFSDILDNASPETDTSVDKLQLLYQLRGKVAEMADYSLFPGKTPRNRDFVNYFLLENHKGYCTHYATSGVILARMAGIPARYATGYVVVGDDFDKSNQNADGSYTITLKDDRSHAWIEVYLDGYGWVPFEFTAGYSSQTIDTSPPTTTTEAPTVETETTAAEDPKPDNNDPSTTRRNTATTAANTTGTSAATNAATTNGGGFSGGFGHGGGRPIPKFVKYLVWSFILAALVALMVLARRWVTLYLRKKHFTENTSASRAGYMYKYVEELLEYAQQPRGDMQYTKYAEFIEERYGGIYFNKGDFEKYMDISLRAAFSETSPDRSEMDECCVFVNGFAKKLYEKKKRFGKFYMKYIACYV